MYGRPLNVAGTAGEAIYRVFHDPILSRISLFQKEQEEHLEMLFDRLIEHPCCIESLYIANNILSKELCVKIAQFVALSPSIKVLNLANSIVDDTFLFAIAASLQTNKSLQCLFVYRPFTSDRNAIDDALVDTLRINPCRPMFSFFGLYYRHNNEYDRLKMEAKRRGHPTLQMLLVGCHLSCGITTTRFFTKK